MAADSGRSRGRSITRLMTATRTVRTPAGIEWRLERRPVRPNVRRPRWPGRRELSPDALNLIGPVPFDGDLIGWLAIFVGLIAIVIIVIPLILFGIELIIFGVVAGTLLLVSLVLGPHWLIRATNTVTGAVYEQEIAGRRTSGAALDELADMIRAGDEPISSPVPVGRRASVPPPH